MIIGSEICGFRNQISKMRQVSLIYFALPTSTSLYILSSILDNLGIQMCNYMNLLQATTEKKCDIVGIVNLNDAI